MPNSLKIDSVNVPERVVGKSFVSKNNGHTFKILSVKKEAGEVELNGDETIYNSVIVDPDTNHLLCVSPWKSLSIPDFLDKMAKDQYGDKSQLVIDEMVEGTMINLFYVPSLKSWEISTRRGVGGNYWFYRVEYGNDTPSQKTFLHMFMDALRQPPNTTLNDVDFITKLPKHYCYSFVCQHPENHLVYNIHTPKLYLVGAFECINTTSNGENCVYDENAQSWNEVPRVRYINTHSHCAKQIFEEWEAEGVLSYPEQYETDNLFQFIDEYCLQSADEKPMGLMITDIYSGIHASVDNPKYVALKELRGNNPNLQYHFFALAKEMKLMEFLHKFPMYSQLFGEFIEKYRAFTKRVYEGYVRYYIYKDKTHIDKKYFVYIAKIHHEIYIPSFQQNKKQNITYNVVCDYFNRLEPSELIHCVNA